LASAVLIDRQFAWRQAIDQAAVAPGCGLIAAADEFIPSADEIVSDVRIDAEAESVAADLAKRGGKVATIACDVSDAAQCQALLDRSLAAMGGVDIFVNNAGIGFMMKPMLDVDPSDWAKVIAVNLSGAFYCTQAAAKAMIAAGKVAAHNAATHICMHAAQRLPRSSSKRCSLDL
jgi:NAD(P)-dependent dehydrogenase (short-subunit alcohol dehydrogenase family)